MDIVIAIELAAIGTLLVWWFMRFVRATERLLEAADEMTYFYNKLCEMEPPCDDDCEYAERDDDDDGDDDDDEDGEEWKKR